MKRILPLVFTACVSHNVGLEGFEYNSPEAFLLRSTESLTFELSGRRTYSRSGDDLFLVEGNDGLGYYNPRGFKVRPSSDEIVTYTLDREEGSLKFVVNDGNCREEYNLDLNDERNNKVSLSDNCDVWGSLGDKIKERGRLSFLVMSEDEQDIVRASWQNYMVLEAEVASRALDSI